MFNFEKLEIYEEAKQFTGDVFGILKNFKIDREIEKQIKKAAISVLLNIAEGQQGEQKDKFAIIAGVVQE